MAPHSGPILVDTNVIIECFRIGSWRALSSGYPVETVEDCVVETQTGFQRRRPEQRIDAAKLRATLRRVHPVNDAQRAEIAVRAPDIHLDEGERSLWAHASARRDGWLLCGPDKASLRLGIRLGFRERLVALERLLDDIGHRSGIPLKDACTSRWLARTARDLLLLEESRDPE
ncbi:MAG: hypothetical protein PHO89_03815 [Methylacidiphilaceae bacterium]|nr:hypothetical protein [Candidatus Methylacidiphilaceae bacterium]